LSACVYMSGLRESALTIYNIIYNTQSIYVT
jgi:hypothetical protein